MVEHQLAWSTCPSLHKEPGATITGVVGELVGSCVVVVVLETILVDASVVVVGVVVVVEVLVDGSVLIDVDVVSCRYLAHEPQHW